MPSTSRCRRKSGSVSELSLAEEVNVTIGWTGSIHSFNFKQPDRVQSQMYEILWDVQCFLGTFGRPVPSDIVEIPIVKIHQKLSLKDGIS